MWRNVLLLKYIGLPIPPPPPQIFNFLPSSFNFSQTVGEMDFVSFEVQKMRMFLVQSIVRLDLGLSAVVGCSSFISRVKPLTKVWFQLVLVSWLSCRQQASLFMALAWKNCLPFSVTNSSFILNSGPPMLYFSRYKRPSLLIPAPLALTKIIKTVCPLCS